MDYILEEHDDGFVVRAADGRCIVGEGATSEEAIEDFRSAARFHTETFGG